MPPSIDAHPLRRPPMVAVVLAALVTGVSPTDTYAQPAELSVPFPRTPSPTMYTLSPGPLTTIQPSLGLADFGTALEASASDAFVCVERTSGDGDAQSRPLRVPMMSQPASKPEARIWSARVMAGGPDIRFWYEYTLNGQLQRSEPREYSMTPVQGSRFRVTPDWAIGAVWYQIFPERFRNGNPQNDPRTPDVYPTPWTADWYAVDPAEEAAWRKRTGRAADAPIPSRKGGPIYNWIYERRYGGDLQGIVEKLDELKDLGVTAIYLNPIFQAHSSHKYDATDHRHIDINLAWPAGNEPPHDWTPIASETEGPATWTWTPADRYFVDVFVPECKKRGLRLILDGVWNHCGRRHFAFQDVQKNGDKSPYKDWFTCTFDADGKLKTWKAWDGPSGWLPAFRQTPEGDLVQPVKDYVYGVTRRWMDPNGDGDPSDGIDGWRLDVVPDMGKAFWRDWHKLVRSINNEAITIAEIWQPAHEYLKGDMFDTQMHYPFAFAVLDWLACKPSMNAIDLRQRLSEAFTDAPQTNLIHQNLFASHDTDRYVNMLWNPGREYDRGNNIQNGDKDYKAGKPPKEIYDLSILGVAMQATYVGSPMVYYGDEWGMWGADDPTCRKPVPWPDKGGNQNPDDVVMPEIRERYREWLRLRQHPEVGPILKYGDVRHITTDYGRVFAFERSLNGAKVLVIVNGGGHTLAATKFKVPWDAATRAVLNGKDEIGPLSARWWYIPAP